jgi:hypothetical protein
VNVVLDQDDPESGIDFSYNQLV